jgi:hypothetical protein
LGTTFFFRVIISNAESRLLEMLTAQGKFHIPNTTVFGRFRPDWEGALFLAHRSNRSRRLSISRKLFQQLELAVISLFCSVFTFLQFLYGEAGPTDNLCRSLISCFVPCPSTQPSFRIFHRLHLFINKPRKNGLPMFFFEASELGPSSELRK